MKHKRSKFIQKKRRIARWYEKGLKELEKKGLLVLHPQMDWARCTYWMYCILIEDKAKIKRDKVMEKLKQEGIDTRPFFHPMHTMPPYKSKERFPVAESLGRKGINLPSGVGLTEKEVKDYLWKEFSKFMQGQTVMKKDGKMLYYKHDVDNFLTNPEKRFFD